MEKYWLKLNMNDSIPDSTVLPTPPPKEKTVLGYVNLGLPSNLDLTDDNELGWAETSFDTQSMDEEYHSHSFGMLMKLDVNILKFWEVHVQIIFDHSVFRLNIYIDA
jgi:hypothetical protein